VLGAAVGGMIVITNARTLFEVFEVDGGVRWPVYAALTVVWLLAIAFVVRRHRRDGISLTNREPVKPDEATAPRPRALALAPSRAGRSRR
jgi:uncharacterized protein